MSTRSQIIIEETYQFPKKDGTPEKKVHRDELWFYRHSDGYPEGNMPALLQFLKWVKDEKIRDNVEQSAGWLIMLGAWEYNHRYHDGEYHLKKTLVEPTGDPMDSWKVGAYEPSLPEQHWDIVWLYRVNLTKMTIKATNMRDDTKSFEVTPDNFDAMVKKYHLLANQKKREKA